MYRIEKSTKKIKKIKRIKTRQTGKNYALIKKNSKKIFSSPTVPSTDLTSSCPLRVFSLSSCIDSSSKHRFPYMFSSSLCCLLSLLSDQSLSLLPAFFLSLTFVVLGASSGLLLRFCCYCSLFLCSFCLILGFDRV